MPARWIAFLLVSLPGFAAEEGMTSMPIASPRKSFTVESEEAGHTLQQGAGFGAREPAIRMKNLMMVGGSGYEGMDMSDASAIANEASGHAMSHRHSPSSASAAAGLTVRIETDPSPTQVGISTVTIFVTDARSGAPARGLKPKVQIAMSSMKMETEEPEVRETSPGHYRFKAGFAMRGIWTVRITLPDGEKRLEVEVRDR